MKKILLATALLLAAMTARSQDYTIPVTNINQHGYPHIMPDLSLQFVMRAPDANLVQVDICGVKYDLSKDEKGVWTGSTAPQVPGFHYYSIVIDGVSVADPASESFYGCSRMMSAIDIPEAGCEDFEVKDVPHGQVRELRYYSKVTNSWRPVFVYTPASYESGKKTYPVIYIHHGGGEDHRGWVEQGRTANIMDNLIAAGKAKEAIVVSVNSNVPGRGGYSKEGMSAYASELTENIIPFIEKTFRCKKDAKNRAMCGLSMGGGQSFYIGLPRPEVFRNIGIFSSGIFGGIQGQSIDLEKEVPGMLSNTQGFNKGLDVFYISCGEQDPRISHTKKYTDQMKAAGVKVYFNSFPGDHEWQVWRKSFHEFVQKIF
ncbi:MAG: esterase [Bacteroidales bacterium]|nr:esterase [Bacteroidales bacterium]